MKSWVMFLCLGLLSGGFGELAMAIEEPPFKVLIEEEDFQLRSYDPVIVAETFVDGDFEGAGNEGFRRLAGYIFGGNQKQSKIAMTAPVSLAGEKGAGGKIAMTAPVGLERSGTRFRITFTMPKSYSLDTLPKPNDSRVTLRELPASKLAVIRYSGTWSEGRYHAREARLFDWIKAKGLTPTGSPVFARFNAPFVPWFLRRNEVHIPVQ